MDYDNHPLYKHGKTGRKQSPVRLFTNICPKDVVLPKEEGYRYQHFVRCWIVESFGHTLTLLDVGYFRVLDQLFKTCIPPSSYQILLCVWEVRLVLQQTLCQMQRLSIQGTKPALCNTLYVANSNKSCPLNFPLCVCRMVANGSTAPPVRNVWNHVCKSLHNHIR